MSQIQALLLTLKKELGANNMTYADIAHELNLRAYSSRGCSRVPQACLQVSLLTFCAYLVRYWSHHSFHEVPALWRLHAAHRSVEHMDWMAGSRNHLA